MQQIIDGDLFAFKSAEVDFGGMQFFGVKGLTPKQELPKEPEFGNGNLAVGRVTGQYKAACSFEQIAHEYMALIGSLGPGYGNVPFNIGATYVEINGPGIMKVEIEGACIMSEELNNPEGKASTYKCELSVIKPIKINGLTMFDDGFFSIGGVVSGVLGAIGNALGI